MSYPPLPIDGERWVIMGPPKTGKSHLAESFPGPVEVGDCDAAMNKYVYQDADKKNCNSLREFEKWVRSLSSSSAATIIADPIDRVVTWITSDICGECGAKSLGDVPHAAGWGRLNQRVVSLFTDFWSNAESRDDGSLRATVLVAHSRKGDDGKSMAITASLIQWFLGSVNNIGYTSKNRSDGGMEYLVDLSGDLSTQAGCRCPVLANAGAIPNEYDNIVGLFTPSDKEVGKVLRKLQMEGGITPEQFLALCEEDGKDHPILVVKRAKAALAKPEFLAKLKARIKE